MTPEDVREKALKLWNSQKIQRAHLEGRSLFPWEIPVPKPAAKVLAATFSNVRDEVRLLRENSKDVLGHGYRVEYQRVIHRRLGDQSLPNRVVLDSLEDFLQLTGKRKEFQRFVELSATILTAQQELQSFLIRRPSVVLEHADDWMRLLAVCRYFLGHSKPDLYLRQLEIPGVHTKFIEGRRAILAELLETVLHTESKVPGITGLSDHGFERRFGLRIEVPTIRFRLLDSTCSLGGLTDASVPLPEFGKLSLPVRRVFITENKMNGLCFPDCPEAMVIFGLGYGVRCLAEIPWLQKAAIFYWGDIDTHGFAILDQLREIFPNMGTFLMDEKTLLLFRELWGREEPGQRFMKQLTRLTPGEKALFESLRNNRWGESIRLEQERIAFGYVRQVCASL
ncbi:MAG: Wadjet anti-phage system protein JetD domain-containing protein [Elusimicrobiota bacterium]|jgi:hypothetical protein